MIRQTLSGTGRPFTELVTCRRYIGFPNPTSKPADTCKAMNATAIDRIQPLFVSKQY